MARKTRTRQKQNADNFAQHNHFELKRIEPLTHNQELFFKSYERGQNIVGHGYPGTGKSFLSVYLSLKEILETEKYNQLVIIRSAVPSRDIGFLKGTEKEKAMVYEMPYIDIVDDLFGRGDGYNILKMKKLISFETTSFLRSRTLDNAIIFADEIQNMTYQELDTIMGRPGDNSKIILCGDFRQTDLNKPHEKSGIENFMKITSAMPSMDHIEFGVDDIVRSGIVKEYIIKKIEMGF